MTPHVTLHAARRFIERVNPRLTIPEAIAALNTPAIRAAVRFGAPYVKLGTGQRVLISGHAVVAVLSVDARPWTLGSGREGPNMPGLPLSAPYSAFPTIQAVGHSKPARLCSAGLKTKNRDRQNG